MPLPAGPFSGVVGTPAAPQFLRIVMYGTTLESNGLTKPLNYIFDFRAILTAPGGSENTFAANFQAIVEANILAAAASDYTLNSYLSRFMDDPTNAGSILSVGSPGGIGTDRGPSFQAAVIRKLTGLSGRNYRGSTHYGAIPESFTTKDDLNGTGAAAFAAIAADFGSVLSGVSDGVNLFFPIVLSPTLSVLTANPRIFAGAPVINYGVNARLGTMKRRKERS